MILSEGNFVKKFLAYNIYMANAILMLIIFLFYITHGEILFGLCWLLVAILNILEWFHKRKIYYKRMGRKR